MQNKKNYRGDFNSNQMGWSLFGNYYDGWTDYHIGYDYITKFFESDYYNNPVMNVTKYLQWMVNTITTAKTQLAVESLGMAIREIEMSEGDVQEAADLLASKSGGKVPSTINAFRIALQDTATATPWTDAVVNNSVVQGAVKIGDTIIDTSKNLAETVSTTFDAVTASTTFVAKVMKYLPFVLPVVIGYVAYQYVDTKNVVKNIVKKM